MTVRVSTESWERAPLVCRLFGHKITGYAGSTPYGRRALFSECDGLNTYHLTVQCQCDRCGRYVSVVKVHAKTKDAIS